MSTSVEVTDSPLRNEADTTNGYVLDTQTIESTPLGTGSFTQLATLSPGVSAYVADTLGELGLFLRLAPVVVMGGSFVAHVGGHNPLEAADGYP